MIGEVLAAVDETAVVGDCTQCGWLPTMRRALSFLRLYTSERTLRFTLRSKLRFATSISIFGVASEDVHVESESQKCSGLESSGFL